MSLGPGQRLGPYEVLGSLGAGGMGQVFRARDTRLGRDVALKVLPDELAGSAERRSRLEHEARLLASLNHPRIAALYDVLDFERSPVLVMEVVEGETLDERLERGPLPLKSALEIAHSIAEALEAAHEKGILHRDLKPSNVKLTPEGGVKVLDFGLAKALEVDESMETLPQPVEKTEAGVAMGTAPYMSPEQARGKPVNKRTDVWAFGCVLYEMLTAKRAFPGATRADALAGVLEREPDWGSLPSSTPDAVRRIVRRCLQKDQKERLRDIADVKLELKDLLLEGTGTAPARRWKASVVAGAALALVFALGALVLLRRPSAPPVEIRQPRTQLTLPRGVDFDFGLTSTLAISPDGRHVVFSGCRSAAECQLYLRDRLEIDAQPISGTEGATGPFFSPDGRFVGFEAQGKLKKIDLERGAVQTVADVSSLRGGSWGEDGVILFSTGSEGLSRVPSEGGDVDEVTRIDAGEHDHRWPQVLPGGRAALFEILYEEAVGASGSRGHDVAVLDLEAGTKRILVERAGCPKYVDGHLLFGRDGILYAAPFDIERLELGRPPAAVLEGVAMSSSPIIFTASGVIAYDTARDGTLLFSPLDARQPKRTLVSFDRQGRREVLSSSQRSYYKPTISPDGRRIAVTVQTDVDAIDAFVLDIAFGAWTRVNVDEEISTSSGFERPYFYAAGWMPDGEHLLLAARGSRNRRMLLVPLDGSERAQTFPIDISGAWLTVAPDGSAVVARVQPGARDYDIWRIALTGEREPEPWLATQFDENNPSFSSDGRWVAYASAESGRFEVYVRPYAGSGVYQVSTEGGELAVWSRSGGEIFFVNRGSLWSAKVRTSPAFAADPPQKLFDLPEDVFVIYDVFPDGQKFVMVQADPLEMRPLDLVVVPGWVDEMKARLAAAK